MRIVIGACMGGDSRYAMLCAGGSSIHPTQGTQFRGPRDAPSRTVRNACRLGVGRSVSQRRRQNWHDKDRVASRRAGGLVDTGPPTPRCAALPVQPIPFCSPTFFRVSRGQASPRVVVLLAGLVARPSVRRLRHRAGRNIHSPAVGACMRADSPRPGRILT